MPTYNLKITIPQRLDRILAAPLVLGRWLWYGYTFRRIRLNIGKHARVDPSRFHELSKYTWIGVISGTSYVAVRLTPEGSCRFPVYMHRQILNARKGQIVDHKDRNSLDNRVDNLRFATYSQNARNKPKIKLNSSSRYVGVYFEKRYGKWTAQISVEGKHLWLGKFDSEIEAAKTYDDAAKKYHREFACLNFPERKIKGLRGLLRHGFNIYRRERKDRR